MAKESPLDYYYYYHYHYYYYYAGPGSRAVQGVRLRSLDFWDRGFEFPLGMDFRLLCLLHAL
jgi:hypothetical protein